LDFHLLEFAAAEGVVSWVDLVAEGLADLGDSERELDTLAVEDVLEVDEYPLSRFRAQVRLVVLVAQGTDVGLEHQVEGARFGELPFLMTFRTLKGTTPVFV